MEDKHVTLITPLWNGGNAWETCWRSVCRNTYRERIRWILVRNSADPEYREQEVESAEQILHERRDWQVSLLTNDENVGVPRAQNQALDLVYALEETDHVLLLDQDTEAHSMWLCALLWHIEDNPRIGLLSASRAYGSKPPPVFHHRNGNWYTYDCSDLVEGETVDTAAVLWNTELLARRLYFDEAFERYDGYDQDLCFRVRSWGFTCEVFDSGVDHYGQSTMKRQGWQWDDGGRSEWSNMRAKNIQRFADRWAPYLRDHRGTPEAEIPHLSEMNALLLQAPGELKAVPAREPVTV